MPRLLLRLFAAIAICLSLLLFLSLILTPDPVGSVFVQAQKLENAGLVQAALARYELIAQRHPESPYAPRAIENEAELLEARAKQNGDTSTLRRAAALYLRLAKSYPKSPSAPSALQSAGELATQLNDRPLARAIYTQILDQNGEATEVGAGALVQLARLQIQDGQGKEAQRVLQGVIRKWNGNAGVGAQAQYFLGLCYETLFKNHDWARRAYDQVIAQYPTSDWATQARSRLGLLVFSDIGGRPPTRRVMLDIAPLPDEIDTQTPDDSVWSALRVALAARGLSGDPVLSRGYSLAPFYAGINLNDPGKTVEPPFDAWENAVGAAGYRYTIKGGGREDEALRDLQNELDAAHVPMVFWQKDDAPVWSVCVGYDSERGEVMLQNRGAQFDTLAAKTWAARWKINSQFGKPYTLISLVPSGQGKDAKANPSLTPTPIPTPLAGKTPAPVIEGPPAFVWQIAPVKEAAPVRRTARRAAAMLARSEGEAELLNGAALDLWTQTLEGAAREARAPASAPLPAPTPAPTPTPTPAPPSDSPIYDPLPTPTSAPQPKQQPRTQPVAAPVAASRELLERAARLWPFWGAPAQDWIDKRREAANWCRLAALKTGDTRLNGAATAFDASADALQLALQNATALDVSTLSDDSNALAALAKSCRVARDAERVATRILNAE